MCRRKREEKEKNRRGRKTGRGHRRRVVVGGRVEDLSANITHITGSGIPVSNAVSGAKIAGKRNKIKTPMSGQLRGESREKRSVQHCDSLLLNLYKYVNRIAFRLLVVRKREKIYNITFFRRNSFIRRNRAAKKFLLSLSLPEENED